MPKAQEIATPEFKVVNMIEQVPQTKINTNQEKNPLDDVFSTQELQSYPERFMTAVGGEVPGQEAAFDV
jgi:hypothetical protein